MKKKVDLPMWAKPGQLVWIDVRDQSGKEVLEYMEGVILEADFEKKFLKVKYTQSEQIKEINGDWIHQRLQEHKVVENLSDIPQLNDAELLKHLEVRYKNNLIHTYCGPTLVVVNPYKRIEHEESEEKYQLIMRSLKERKLESCPPHLWTISAYCYQFLFDMNINQAICISGESGAGKTESAKRCMAFLTKMKSRRQSSIGSIPIEEKILACNPLLEAFGNAKTFRNDNSSRFGKYTILYLSKNTKKVKGASIENYLLEKSRICVQSKEERNYHIFYALCRCAPKEKLEKLKLLNDDGTCNMTKFNYLNQSGIYECKKIDDQEFYDEVCKALVELEFTEEEQDCIWRNLAAILYFGNLEVDDSTYEEGSKGCKIKKGHAWECIVELLEINPENLEDALVYKEIKVNNNVTRTPLSPLKCKNSIDSLAKEIYNNMFTWIILKLNKTLVPQANLAEFSTIGLLDIFGFEIFDKNSLEQFFINYANERLQSLYIEYIFKNECQIFEQEGLGEYTALIVYTDNKHICLALDNPKMPPGIFLLIDQACALNNDDEYLHAEIQKNHRTSSAIQFPRFVKQMSFIVQHTARDVEYKTESFVEKNKDELSKFLKEAFSTSNQTIVNIFNKISGLPDSPKVDPNARVNPKEKYLGYKFRKDMNNLIEQLIKCYCHFIRCIKPNEFKKSDFWNPHLSLLQIRYMGMLDSLKVRKQSYPFRFKYSDFFQIYQDLDMGENGAKNFRTLQQEQADFKSLTKEILKYCEKQSTDKDVLFGKTKIFLNEGYKIWLDKALLVKQKKKKDALKILTKLYKRYKKSEAIKSYFQTTAKSIMISRDLLKSWTAKLEGMKFKNYLRILKKMQFKFKFLKEKRKKRYKKYNMQIIMKFLGLYKFSQVIEYIAHYKRRVIIMQAMLDRKIKDAKNRYCKALIDNIINDSWSKISKKIQAKSVLDIQRSFRSYLLRQKKQKEFEFLKKKMAERQIFSASSAVQKFIRGYLVRSRLERLNRAAAKIQGYFKMRWMRRYFLRIRSAVRVIQRFFRKHLILKKQIDERMNKFMKVYGNYHENVARLEEKILFGDQEELTDLQNVNDYTKLPFYIESGTIDFGHKNYLKFLPKSPEIELHPKSKLVSLLVDINVQVDTTNVYYNTWSQEFLNFLKKIHKKNKRLLHLEIGESFTMAITDDREVYSWGLNDQKQCAKEDHRWTISQSEVKNLSVNKAKILSTGKDHGIMVDNFNNIFIWGRNSEGQLGINNTKKTEKIIVLNTIKSKIQTAVAKDNKNYLLTKKGTVYHWPSYKDGENILEPSKINFNFNFGNNVYIQDISAGTDFVIFLTNNGLLYSMGDNQYGQLGLGHTENVSSPHFIRDFKKKNEKIIEVSCGNKHVICRTALNKVFTWGSNVTSQLGTGDFMERALPFKIEFPQYKTFRQRVRSVSAGLTSSFILLDDRNIFYMGKCGYNQQRIVHYPTRFSYEDKFFTQRMADNFTPIRVYTKWSSLMSVTYIVFSDFRKVKLVKTIREKFCDKINQIWTENRSQILPNQNDILYQNIDYKYLITKNKKQPPNFKYSGKEKMNKTMQTEMQVPEDPSLQVLQESVETGIPETHKKSKKVQKTPRKKKKPKKFNIEKQIQKIKKKKIQDLTAEERKLLFKYSRMKQFNLS